MALTAVNRGESEGNSPSSTSVRAHCSLYGPGIRYRGEKPYARNRWRFIWNYLEYDVKRFLTNLMLSPALRFEVIVPGGRHPSYRNLLLSTVGYITDKNCPRFYLCDLYLLLRGVESIHNAFPKKLLNIRLYIKPVSPDRYDKSIFKWD